MLDAVHRLFKVPVFDAHAASALSCSLRLHNLMEHGVTLLEDPMTPRQPIMSSPALYFFAVEDASVRRVAADWMAKVPHMDAHIFSLGWIPHRRSQQLAWARTAPRVMSFKEMMLDFTAPEVLVFHPRMQNGFPQLLSPPTRESVLDVAASRLVAAFDAVNNSVPVIRHHNSGNICHGVAGTFFEVSPGTATTSRISLRGADSCGNPVRILVD
ncbi:putative syntaxin binding protein 1 [Trypanosoma cruzi]|uniref:Putative syntaxin binding protein 1 n=1 Tax=Trypanosoma cruzi TaxID=5693 RepID=A0A2V2WMX8_TRYCR|nr:putative syntaxin binding protein 1 [Trypanosoma cruzi]RNC57376.1 syntaxin binding protein [Trypanosoma cruzi]